LIYQSPENPYSYLTAKERTEPSFPLRRLLSNGLIYGRVLDFGSGLGTDVAYLLERGIQAEAYDPYYAPQIPSGYFDTILCTYVLNVLLPVEQAHVLMAISELLAPSGSAFFTVRRDIRKAGYRTHAIHQERVYQCNVILPFQSIALTKHCEIYRYQHINQRKPLDSEDCTFCNPDKSTRLITESATAYAIELQGSSIPGHCIVVPKSHIPQFFDLPERNKTACWLMVERTKSILEQIHKPIGFSIQFNLNTAHHQHVQHAHLHVIPTYPPLPMPLSNSL
jgi:ATP adenylyltransferase